MHDDGLRQSTVAPYSIVNVSGDGRSNNGTVLKLIRDQMATAGITINGLYIVHQAPDLLTLHIKEVISGRGRFAVTCRSQTDFREVMRQKLSYEIQRPVV